MAPKDVMLDIETLATDSNALVLSIAAVRFDCSAENTGPWIGYDSNQFFEVPQLLEQILMGRSVDPATQKFWAEQPSAAQAHWAEPILSSPVREVLTDLGAFVEGASRIWANGAVFDFGILESLYRQVGLKVPWKYNVVRDARTFYDTSERCRTSDLVSEGVAHNPLYDCRTQIVRLWEHGLK